ncbi:MAG: hypothetical protein F6K28_50965 [Microcoleus sp. SIO2G3]|nr:hypothetical protein [Microcoleus sp. SIO2G3]
MQTASYEVRNTNFKLWLLVVINSFAIMAAAIESLAAALKRSMEFRFESWRCKRNFFSAQLSISNL